MCERTFINRSETCHSKSFVELLVDPKHNDREAQEKRQSAGGESNDQIFIVARFVIASQ